MIVITIDTVAIIIRGRAATNRKGVATLRKNMPQRNAIRSKNLKFERNGVCKLIENSLPVKNRSTTTMR